MEPVGIPILALLWFAAHMTELFELKTKPMSYLRVSIRSAEDRVTITGFKPSLAVLPSPPRYTGPIALLEFPTAAATTSMKMILQDSPSSD